MKRMNIEFVVGLFVIVGLLSFAYLAIKLGDANPFAGETYTVSAQFGSITGLKEGAPIEIAGVRVGKVKQIVLNGEDYEAVVTMAIANEIELQEDTIASIRTAGIIGDRFIKITPGGAEEIIEPGGEIMETESAISIEELVSKYMFESE